MEKIFAHKNVEQGGFLSPEEINDMYPVFTYSWGFIPVEKIGIGPFLCQILDTLPDCHTERSWAPLGILENCGSKVLGGGWFSFHKTEISLELYYNSVSL